MAGLYGLLVMCFGGWGGEEILGLDLPVRTKENWLIDVDKASMLLR
jgi:hypothetical protein